MLVVTAPLEHYNQTTGRVAVYSDSGVDVLGRAALTTLLGLLGDTALNAERDICMLNAVSLLPHNVPASSSSISTPISAANVYLPHSIACIYSC